ncbi:MAG: hypothetical protein SGILL_005489, partial [Bacillariaceae sp.]
LLLCGPGETSLAKRAFGGEISTEGMLMDLGQRVSRKKEFIPPIASAIQGGWNRAESLGRGLSDVQEDELGHLKVQTDDPYGQVHRFGASLSSRSASEFLLMVE